MRWSPPCRVERIDIARGATAEAVIIRVSAARRRNTRISSPSRRSRAIRRPASARCCRRACRAPGRSRRTAGAGRRAAAGAACAAGRSLPCSRPAPRAPPPVPPRARPRLRKLVGEQSCSVGRSRFARAARGGSRAARSCRATRHGGRLAHAGAVLESRRSQVVWTKASSASCWRTVARATARIRGAKRSNRAFSPAPRRADASMVRLEITGVRRRRRLWAAARRSASILR